MKVRNQNGMNKDKELPMLKRLFLVLQSIFSIPPIIFLFFWLISEEYDYFYRITYGNVFFVFVLSLIPFGLIILGKYIVYGKLYIFKIGQDIKPKKRDSSRKDDSEIGFTSKSDSNRDSYEPPFPDGF